MCIAKSHCNTKSTRKTPVKMSWVFLQYSCVKFLFTTYILETWYHTGLSLERVPRVPRHTLKLGNVCQAHVLKVGCSIENGWLMKKCRKSATSIVFYHSRHTSCKNLNDGPAENILQKDVKKMRSLPLVSRVVTFKYFDSYKHV